MRARRDGKTAQMSDAVEAMLAGSELARRRPAPSADCCRGHRPEAISGDDIVVQYADYPPQPVIPVCHVPSPPRMTRIMPDAARLALFASPLLRRPAADEPNKSDTI